MRMVEHVSRDIYLTYIIPVYRQFYCDTNKQHSGSVDRMDQLAASAGSDHRDRAPGGHPHVGCSSAGNQQPLFPAPSPFPSSSSARRMSRSHLPHRRRGGVAIPVERVELAHLYECGRAREMGLAPKWRPRPTAASTWRQWIIPSLGVGTATALLTADYVLKTRSKTCIREDGDCTNDRR